MALFDTAIPTLPPGSTLPMSGVNLLESLFGRDFDLTPQARNTVSTGRTLIERQLGILRTAGGADSSIFKELESTQSSLNKAASSGDLQGILGLRQGIASVTNKAQNMISPIPEDFKYNPVETGGRQDPSLKPFAASRNPLNRELLPLMRNIQFLDKLEGKGKVFTRRLSSPGRRGQAPEETLGQGYERITQLKGKGGGQEAVFVPINPLDLKAIGTRLAVPQPGDPDFVGPLQEEPSQRKKPGIRIKDIARIGLEFIKPRVGQVQQETGFVASAGGLGSLNFEAEKDLLVPTGFTQKQATRLPLNRGRRTAGTRLEDLI